MLVIIPQLDLCPRPSRMGFGAQVLVAKTYEADNPQKFALDLLPGNLRANERLVPIFRWDSHRHLTPNHTPVSAGRGQHYTCGPPVPRSAIHWRRRLLSGHKSHMRCLDSRKSTFMSGISRIMTSATATMSGPTSSNNGLATGAAVHNWLVQTTRNVSGRTINQWNGRNRCPKANIEMNVSGMLISVATIHRGNDPKIAALLMRIAHRRSHSLSWRDATHTCQACRLSP